AGCAAAHAGDGAVGRRIPADFARLFRNRGGPGAGPASRAVCGIHGAGTTGPRGSIRRHHAQGRTMKEARRMSGFSTLFRKEITRFRKVSFQTVLAPVLTALLYLLIFSHVLEDHVQVYPGVRYTAFLIPGLAMMSLLQNSFANSSSSLIQSK